MDGYKEDSGGEKENMQLVIPYLRKYTDIDTAERIVELIVI